MAKVPPQAPRWETLAELINSCKLTHGAELGVYDGRTTLHLMRHCPTLTLIAVDTWGSIPLPVRKSSRERCKCGHCRATRKVRFRLKNQGGTIHTLEENLRKEASVFMRAEGNSRLDIVKNTTVAAAGDVLPGELDFIFLDAGHDTESVNEDLAAWLPKLRNGGWVFGHDWHFASVRAGVAKHFSLDRVAIHPHDHFWSVRVWHKGEENVTNQT